MTIKHFDVSLFFGHYSLQCLLHVEHWKMNGHFDMLQKHTFFTLYWAHVCLFFDAERGKIIQVFTNIYGYVGKNIISNVLVNRFL